MIPTITHHSRRLVTACNKGAVGELQTRNEFIRTFSTAFDHDQRHHHCTDCCGPRRHYGSLNSTPLGYGNNADGNIHCASTPRHHLHRVWTPYPSSYLLGVPLPRVVNNRQCRNKTDAKSVVVTADLNSDDDADTPAIPGAQKGGKKLAIVFTCTVCETRSIKQFTENAYMNGVVIAQCPGCKNRHLIADNLGFFEDDVGGWNIEKALNKMGENVRVVTNDDVMELSVEDLYGKGKIREATAKAKAGTSEGKT